MWGSIKGKNKIVCKWFLDNQPPINLLHRNEDDKNVIFPTYEVYILFFISINKSVI